MKMVKNGDLWAKLGQPNHVVVVTTNQVTCKAGLVMGAGVALEAKKRLPTLPKRLEWYGFLVNPYIWVYLEDLGVAAFQTKVNWKDASRLDLISDAFQYLDLYAQQLPEITWHCPLVGCGNGGLNWEKDILSMAKMMPDNVIFYDNRNKV